MKRSIYRKLDNSLRCLILNNDSCNPLTSLHFGFRGDSMGSERTSGMATV
jgi:hypothetical protein